MYSLLIGLLLCQLKAVRFRICVNLVQFTPSNAFCQTMKHAHSSSSMSTVHFDVTLGIWIASPVPFPLLKPNWPCPRASSIFLSILLLSSLLPSWLCVCEGAECAMVAAFCSYDFFFKAIIVTSLKSFGHSPV